ncbi:hypothetical protein J437_LFUL005817 [Ladona fulva]|uniref:MULE transposase domain-containing protein n=1 Tax=Ladona fulva TaxID=123851 RepID=A0A8K0KDW6_LADFU|nr:hypothetical protein J437_LFUL005817 [Ladona fulva]
MDRSKGKKKYWRCENRRICNGRAISFATDGEIEVIITKEHTHAPRYQDISVQRMKTSLKRKAIEQLTAHPVALIREGLSDLGDFAVAALPKHQSLRRMINRTRESLRPTDPRHIKDLHIIPPFANTISGQQFLLHDSEGSAMAEEGTRSRVIIFASEENIRYLFSSPTWYTDGTFQVVPTLFYQLFTVHGSVAGTVLPMVYALMQNKREEEYNYVLQKLKEKAREMGIPNWDTFPSNVMMDFEKAAINVFRSVFPNAEIGLCLFHFGKSLYCKIQEVGLQRQYNEGDSKVRQWLLSVIGLAFVPPEDVISVFELLLGELNEEKEDSLLPLEEIADYIDKTYIRGHPVRGRRRALPPTYAVEMWNMYQRTRDDIARTNNAVEGWHNKFNKMVNKKKVTMYSLLEEIRKEQHDTEAAILQINSGHHNIKQICSRKTILRSERIKGIVQRYEEFKENGQILQYLKSLGYNFEF